MTDNSRALSTQLAEREVSKSQWHTLSQSLFPGAKTSSILLVVDYCRARNLDPLKKPCHIVPMEIYNAQTGKYEKRDVVLPGIYELRTTAQRTGEYLGHSRPEYGEKIDYKGVQAPEWCEMTIYRWNAQAKQRTEFPVRVYFTEAVATKFDKTTKEQVPNARWSKAPIQMLTKCTEAAGLREAFPDEIGGEMSAEEMEGQNHRHTIDVTPDAAGIEDLNAELGLHVEHQPDEPIEQPAENGEWLAAYEGEQE